MVAVPVRADPELAAIFSFTLADPVPDAPDAMVIQEACDAAVHAHDPPVVNATVAEPPAEATASLDGLIE